MPHITLVPGTRCRDGNLVIQDHDATGWLCALDGRRIIPACFAHASAVIDEYRKKLGVLWTFEASERTQ